MYDAIIVGARCAGSPLAMLLARKGYRVLLLDKASFPSDTISTHHIHQPGVALLKRWGLLEKLRASNCPPTEQIKFDVGPFALVGAPTPADGTAESYGPRRRVLDKILVDAAVDAGAELRERFTVEELTTDGTSITGIRGHDANGSTVTERARIVIGADGARSMVADAVEASIYFDRGMLTCNYYTYWSGVPHDGVELYPRPGRTIVVDKTNDGLSMICIVFPKDEFNHIKSNVESEYLRTIQQNAPTLFERISNGKREERFAGTGFLPNFFRKPYGDGWALVGDAGYVKDPILAQGITDSFTHAEMLAHALDESFSGRCELQDALSDYERHRNNDVVAMFEHNSQLATLQPPPPELAVLLNALQGNQVEIGRFLGTVAGTVSVTEFFSPENVRRISGTATLKPAA